MITFKEFLCEEKAVQDAREFFHREAGPFIQQANGAGVFLRGSDAKPPPFARVKLPSGRVVDVGMTTVRKDRRPMNMPIEFHNAANDWMKDTFDVDGRAGSAFVLGERGWTTASFYGEHLYAVIPHDKFKFLWSPKVNDLYDQFAGYNGIDETVRGLTGEAYTQAVRDQLEKLDFKNTDLPAALASRVEVMIDCDHLLVVEVTDIPGVQDGREVLHDLKEALK